MKSLKKILPVIFFGGVCLFWILFYVMRVGYLLDSDMASEMLLSDLLAKEGGILSKSWLYSTELRVLNNQIPFSIFLKLSGSMAVSRILSGIFLSAMLMLSFYYFCRQWGLKEQFFLIAPFLFLPLSVNYAYIVLYGLFYIPHIAISFTTLAMVRHTEQCKKKGIRVFIWIMLILLSLTAGMGGPRQLVILYLPLLMLTVTASWFKRRLCMGAGIAAFAAGTAGYIINSRILSQHYSFNGWNSLDFVPFSFGRLEELINGALNTAGYRCSEVFSPGAVCSLAAFAVIAAVILYAVNLIKLKDRPEEESLAAGYILMSFAVFFMIYLFTDMYYEDRYYLPLVVFFIPLFGYSLNRCRDGAGYLLHAAVGICAAAGALAVFVSLYRTDKTSELKAVTERLVSEGYESGYASFWNSNVTAELSEGRIEMFGWDDYVTEKIDVEELYLWLQPASHREKKPEGKVFILLDDSERGTCPLERYLDGNDIAAENAGYVAYGFESYKDMLGKLSHFEYDLDDDSWLEGGESLEGIWLMHPGAVSSGPNVTLYRGSYEFTIKGEGLEGLELNATAGFGMEMLTVRLLEQSENEAVYGISVPANTYHAEFCMKNISDGNVIISGAELNRI